MTEIAPTAPTVPTAHADLSWRHDDTDAARAHNRVVAGRVEALVRRGARAEVVAALDAWPPSSVLECFRTLRTRRAQTLLRWMSDEMSLRLLSQIDPKFHVVLFEDHTRSKFEKVLARMDRHRAVRFLTALPLDYALSIVHAHRDADSLRTILQDADSAEAAMRQGAVVVREADTLRDVIEDIRRRSDRIDRIDGLHVVDDHGRLTGYLKLRDLILNDGETPVASVARRDPLSVARDTDREAVLHLANQRGESVIAVVDEEGVLLGVIGARQLTEIAQREAQEDMLLMSGVSPESTGFDSPREIVRRRLPWLLTGLAGAMMTAFLVGTYEETLTQAAILASFIPVVTATAGNASMQASTISIQAITSGATWRGDFLHRIGREIAGAAVNGALMGLGVGIMVIAASIFAEIERVPALAATVALAQLSVILMAGTVGTLVPFVLKSLRFDPAVATGIFILTINDVAGVFVLFAIATRLYL